MGSQFSSYLFVRGESDINWLRVCRIFLDRSNHCIFKVNWVVNEAFNSSSLCSIGFSPLFERRRHGFPPNRRKEKNGAEKRSHLRLNPPRLSIQAVPCSFDKSSLFLLLLPKIRRAALNTTIQNRRKKRIMIRIMSSPIITLDIIPPFWEFL